MTLTAAAQAGNETASQQFQRVSDAYFDQVYFPYQPTGGTVSGYHQYDTKLEDFSHATIDAEVAALKDFEKRISVISPAALDQTTRGDRQMVLNDIHSHLLTLETIRPWAKNADGYSSTCAGSAFTLMERKFAPADDRLRSLIAREKQMPGLIAEAHTNLENPPRIFTEIAIDQLPGIISFFEHDVPLAFADAHDAALKAEFAQTNAAVIKALNDYLAWLKTDLLPRSNGDFRIGADTFSKKLQYDEMVDLPLPKLLEIGYDDMRQQPAALRRSGSRTGARQDSTARCSKNWAASIPLPISSSMLSRLLSPASSTSSARTTSSPFLRMCGRCSKRRRPSCAPQPRPAWIRLVPTKPTPPPPTSTSRCPIHR